MSPTATWGVGGSGEAVKLQVQMALGVLSSTRNALWSHKPLRIAGPSGPQGALVYTKRTPEPQTPVNYRSKGPSGCSRLYETHSGATNHYNLHVLLDLKVLLSTQATFQSHKISRSMLGPR